MENNVTQEPETNKKLTVEDLDVEVLPIIYDIIRSVEKDHHDNSGKSRESQDCSQKVLELQKKLDQIRSQIRLLPGIDFSKEQQLNNLESLKAQLRLKQELLQKYRFIIIANNEHLIQRLSESYPMRKAAQVVVRAMNTSKDFAQQYGIDKKLTPEEFRNLMRAFGYRLQNQLKQAQEDIKKKMTK